MIQLLTGAGLALILTVVFAPVSVKLLSKMRAGQPILHYVDNHQSKQGTPTMGGLFMILAILIAGFSLMRGASSMGIVVLASVFGYGAIGFMDDFIKIRSRNNQGLAAYQKILAQLGLAIILSVYCYRSGYIGTELVVPFVWTTVNVGWGIIPIAIVVLLAFTNSVNLTDGLDGLASTTTAAYLVPFLGVLIALYTVMGEDGTGIALMQEWSNVLICGGAMLGAVLGFLLFNANPARVFMGDTGSLALGGGLAVLALSTKTSFLIPLMGIMFVWSSISVIVQVIGFKLTRKRVFLMAPFHHHLERKGWSETRICVLYGLLTLVVGCIPLFVILS